MEQMIYALHSNTGRETTEKEKPYGHMQPYINVTQSVNIPNNDMKCKSSCGIYNFISHHANSIDINRVDGRTMMPRKSKCAKEHMLPPKSMRQNVTRSSYPLLPLGLSTEEIAAITYCKMNQDTVQKDVQFVHIGDIKLTCEELKPLLEGEDSELYGKDAWLSDQVSTL